MKQPLDALIFDFDGLILDTETPEFDILQKIYAEHAAELTLERWAQIIGGSSFDPGADLEQLLGSSIDRDAVLARWRTETDRVIAAQAPLPGVIDLLDDAQLRGLKLAVASSSPHEWVDGHLKRLGLFERFDHIVCADDVTHAKPSPELFLLAQTRLNVRADRVVIFEDSPNGVKAANAAGIPVVAIPNPVTAKMDFRGEHVRLSSLSEFHILDWTVYNGIHSKIKEKK